MPVSAVASLRAGTLLARACVGRSRSAFFLTVSLRLLRSVSASVSGERFLALKISCVWGKLSWTAKALTDTRGVQQCAMYLHGSEAVAPV